MRAAIRSQEDPASGLFAAFVMAAAWPLTAGRGRVRPVHAAAAAAGRRSHMVTEFSGTTGWLAREPGKSPVTPAYPQLTATMAAAVLGDRLRLCAPPYAHADSQCSVSGLNLMKHQVAGDSRRPPVRSVSSGRAARPVAEPTTSTVGSFTTRGKDDPSGVHAAMVGLYSPSARPLSSILATRPTSSRWPTILCFSSTGLNELQNDRSPGSGRGTEGHGQLCRLRPNETVLGHRARTRHQLDVAAGVGESSPARCRIFGRVSCASRLLQPGLRHEAICAGPGRVGAVGAPTRSSIHRQAFVTRPPWPLRPLLRRGLGFDLGLFDDDPSFHRLPLPTLLERHNEHGCRFPPGGRGRRGRRPRLTERADGAPRPATLPLPRGWAGWHGGRTRRRSADGRP